MIRLLVQEMRANEAPEEQFERLGLPVVGEPSREHLQIERYWDRVQQARVRAARVTDFPEDSIVARTPVAELMADDRRWSIILEALPHLADSTREPVLPDDTLVSAAGGAPRVTLEHLQAVEDALRALEPYEEP